MRKFLIALLSLALSSSVGAQSCCDRDTANPPAFTWASKPTCSSAGKGRQIHISDVGMNSGSQWRCNGTNWYPSSGSDILLYQFTTPTTVTGTTDETQVGATLTIPAGLVGAQSRLRLQFMGTDYTNNSNTKKFTLQLGTSSGASCINNTEAVIQNTGGSLAVVQGGAFIYSKNSTSAQGRANLGINSPWSTGAGTEITYSVDFSVTEYACVSMTLANGSDSATVSYWALYLDYQP